MRLVSIGYHLSPCQIALTHDYSHDVTFLLWFLLHRRFLFRWRNSFQHNTGFFFKDWKQVRHSLFCPATQTIKFCSRSVTMKLQSNYAILFKKENLLEREMTKMRYVLNMKQDTFLCFQYLDVVKVASWSKHFEEKKILVRMFCWEILLPSMGFFQVVGRELWC